jgi:hypothetical protein
MDDLVKAIVTTYNSDTAAAIALRAATPGGMWLGAAPQTITGTYIVLVPVGSAVDHTMGTTNHAFTVDGTIQFSVCDPSNMVTAATAASKLITLYEDSLLTCDNHRVLYARRVNNGVPMRDPDGGGYWMMVDFRYIIGNKQIEEGG